MATLAHLNGYVLRLKLAGSGGETLEPSDSHLVWSEDRQAYVPAGAMQVGERLQTAAGPARIASITPKAGIHRVYNIEVEQDHRYFVGQTRTLVHNESFAIRFARRSLSSHSAPLLQPIRIISTLVPSAFFVN